MSAGLTITDLNSTVSDVLLVKFDSVFDINSSHPMNRDCGNSHLIVDRDGPNKTSYCNDNPPHTNVWLPYQITGSQFIFQLYTRYDEGRPGDAGFSLTYIGECPKV